MWITLRDLGEELLPEVREIIRDYFAHPEMLSTLTMEELRHALVILLDLRNSLKRPPPHRPNIKHH